MQANYLKNKSRMKPAERKRALQEIQVWSVVRRLTLRTPPQDAYARAMGLADQQVALAVQTYDAVREHQHVPVNDVMYGRWTSRYGSWTMT